MAGNVDTPGTAWGVALAGTYAYVGDSDGGVRVIKVTTFTAPVEVSGLPGVGYVRRLETKGNYVVAAGGWPGLKVEVMDNFVFVADWTRVLLLSM